MNKREMLDSIKQKANPSFACEWNILDCIRDVIETEMHGITMMRNHIGDEFLQAIDILYNTTGKVITGGVGKSGHIAAKMASTFSSLGISSFFMHSNEASHGDLGAISVGDSIILLSNSGNTSELSDKVYYAQRLGVPIIAITSNLDSMLSKNATVTLSLPNNYTEASDLDAPTTSSTMMMVLGDAIAVTLQKITGFSKEDYGFVHPGGKLGAQLKIVKDVMHAGEECPIVSQNDNLNKVIEVINNKKLGCVCVVDQEHKVIGMITDGDLRRNFGLNPSTAQARDIMNHSPAVISHQSFLSAALKIMEDHKITSLIVVDENKRVVGMLHLHSCMQIGLI